MNRFEYDEKHSTLTGIYDEKIVVASVHRKVITILKNNKDNIITDMGTIASQALYMLSSPKEVTTKDCVSTLMGAVSVMGRPTLLSEYQRESNEHIRRIDATTGPLKIMYMEMYIAMLRKYLNVSISYVASEKKDPRECVKCGAIGEEEACDQCGRISKKYLTSAAYVTTGMVASDTRGNSDAKANFWKKYLKYQGRAGSEPPKELIDEVQQYFKEHCLQINDDPKYRIKNVELMYSVLKSTGYSKYNSDITVICNKIWGWPLPNLSHLDARISREFDEAQAIIETEKKERIANINNGWRLWRHLLQAEYECDPGEFRIPKTTTIVKFYEELWVVVCEKLGWSMKVTLCD